MLPGNRFTKAHGNIRQNTFNFPDIFDNNMLRDRRLQQNLDTSFAYYDPLDIFPERPYIKTGGSILNNNDFYLRKTNKNSYYCIVFTDTKTESIDFYEKFLLKYNNLPKDGGSSLNHFNTIQNWFIVNPSYLENNLFYKFLKTVDYNSEILMLIGWGSGAKNLWKYLPLNKVPIIFLDPIIDEQGLEYYSTMSERQRNMTIINSNSNNWNNNKQTQRLLKIIENNYQNFDNSLIKQPSFNGLDATHNLIGQPLFNNNIIIKSYDAILNTSYYRDNVKLFDLSDDRYIRRYNI